MSDFSFSDVGINLPTFKDIEEKSIDELQAVAKFHHHETGWVWYVIAGEPRGEDMLLHCYVMGAFNEFGNVMLSELLNVGAMFCPTFKPIYIKDLTK